MIRDGVGRNDPCPCGSGKKLKKCCMFRGPTASRPPRSSFATPAMQGGSFGHSSARPAARSAPPGPRATAFDDMSEPDDVADESDLPELESVPLLPVEVGLDYTYPEPFGEAEITYIYPAGQTVQLADGRLILNEHLKPGMRVILRDGAVATITAVKLSYDHPEPPVDVGNGLVLSRVVGTIKHRGPATVDVSWPGYQATSSPDHLYYSVSRRGYVPAQELQVGEFLRTDVNTVAPVQAVSRPRYEMLDLYNVEVEHFHNYHVGQPGGNAVLVHNGTEYIQTLKKYDLVDELKGGRTLLVGEGNLSFGLSLARKGRIDARNLVVTTYEAEAALSPAAWANAQWLRSRGATVLHGVDATDLAATFGKDAKFDRIVWNFPFREAGGRTGGNIYRANQELMAGFFESASNHLNPNGRVVITLHERYFVGWNVQGAAQNAGFGSVVQAPYQLGNFPGYQPVTTYRGVRQPDFTKGITWIFGLGGQ
jgi:hypothetical protein